jgi:hypothetical protein
MVDWIAIAWASFLTAVIGVAVVLWERYEAVRLARVQARRRVVARHRREPATRRRAA